MIRIFCDACGCECRPQTVAIVDENFADGDLPAAFRMQLSLRYMQLPIGAGYISDESGDDPAADNSRTVTLCGSCWDKIQRKAVDQYQLIQKQAGRFAPGYAP